MCVQNPEPLDHQSNAPPLRYWPTIASVPYANVFYNRRVTRHWHWAALSNPNGYLNSLFQILSVKHPNWQTHYVTTATADILLQSTMVRSQQTHNLFTIITAIPGRPGTTDVQKFAFIHCCRVCSTVIRVKHLLQAYIWQQPCQIKLLNVAGIQTNTSAGEFCRRSCDSTSSSRPVPATHDCWTPATRSIASNDFRSTRETAGRCRDPGSLSTDHDWDLSCNVTKNTVLHRHLEAHNPQKREKKKR